MLGLRSRCASYLIHHQNILSIKYKSCPSLFTVTMEQVTLFQGIKDRFSGITISSTDQHHHVHDLETTLKESIKVWEEDKLRGVWFKIYLDHAEWVPILAKNGFTYHHAQEHYVMMVRWLPQNETNIIPRYAHNLVGVGAFVVNDSDELLVVKERFWAHPHWKLPGGYVERGENLHEAAIREVKEETGIEAEFMSLISFRHTHNVNFSCDDLYFVALLKPKTLDITMCKKELAACQWMKLDEYKENPHVNTTNKFFVERYLENKRNGTKIESSYVYNETIKRDQQIYTIALNKTLCNGDKGATDDSPVDQVS